LSIQAGIRRRLRGWTRDEDQFVHARIAIAFEIVYRDPFQVWRYDDLHLFRMAPALTQHRVKPGDFFAGLGRIEVEAEPSVTDVGDPFQRRSALAAEEHRQISAARWFGKRTRVVELYELAMKAGHLLVPQAAHHLDVLAGARGAPLKRNPESGKFFGGPSNTHPERKASAAKTIERGHLLGEDQGIVLGYQTNPGGQPDLAGDRSGEGQGDERIQPVRICGEREVALGRVGILGLMAIKEDYVFSHPQRGKACALRVLGGSANDRRLNRCTDA
jgi:hypothetical protein